MGRLTGRGLRRTRTAGWTTTLVGAGVAAWVSSASVAVAADGLAAPPADKSGYTLFDPTPRPLMRELSPDRPDVTESPFTVDAGHVQAEFSFAEWRKGDDGEELAVLPANLKIGLTNNVDLQLVVAPYLRSRTPGRTDDGHGDAEVRVKVNVWGNDEAGGNADTGLFAGTALAVMPYVRFPVGAQAFSNDDRVEGGVIVPLAVPLPAGFDLTVMAEVDFVRDGTGGYDTLLVHTASVEHDLVGPLGAYLEYAGTAPLGGDRPYEATLDTGLTYKVSDDVQIDAGVEVGLTAAADDLRVFAGVTIRR
ncbi:MAG: hypothetical protein JWO31_1454 [Phycisphaerales bacterium]|nr:hypothetical protein [Phycisphaerales bacterium]